jgi:hypothetical protein
MKTKYEMRYLEGCKLSEIIIEGVDTKDAPDFVDSYVVSCYVDGRKASNDEIEYINDEMPWVAQEKAFWMLCA